ncbi:MAG: hypothetical protein AB7V13_31390 [Pseudorhodoplanes sp.]|uniref:hypothetical protein n=1 Tax=Pseudorhodoplanes sp. TaxID=1934341 RepID=UPI003D0F3AA2
MWGRKKPDEKPPAPISPLKEALRQARIESAERTGIVVDMRDAEAARLDMLNEALDPVFAEVPANVDIFDRGVSRGDPPRLWIDVTAYVVMGRDKRSYRFVQDTRYGRKVLSESAEIRETARAITRYVAARLIERERALAAGGEQRPRQSTWRAFAAFVFGLMIGAVALAVAALVFGGH